MNQPKIYVGNLSYNTTEATLEETFGVHGTITELKLITDRETGRSKGFAFITFETQAQAEAALVLNDTNLDGRNIRVNLAKADAGGGRRGGGKSHAGSGDRKW